MPEEDLHLSMLVHTQAHLNRFAVGEEDAREGRVAHRAALLISATSRTTAKYPHLPIGIGVGKAGYPGLPSRRTGLAVLPHPALQSVGYRSSGLTGQAMGLQQREKPTLGKEGVGPAVVAEPTASFDPLFKGLQHARRPDRRFHPCPPRG